MMRPQTTRKQILLLATLILLLAAPPPPAAAQELPRAALGAGLGVLGGVGITVANVVARAHWQNEFLHEPGDLIHWQSVPMILAPAAGAAFGFHSWDTLRSSFYGSASGLALGAGVGAVIGRLSTDSAEGPWAGGAIGGGLGLAIGGILGAYIGWKEHEEDRAATEDGALLSLSLRVPAGLIFAGAAR